jgi:acyl-CoA dehydrogenase
MVIKAVWMADNKKPNALESSMSKVKAGDAGTKITQKVVEMMGPLGYSREFLAENGSATPRSPTSTRAPGRSTASWWRGRFWITAGGI